MSNETPMAVDRRFKAAHDALNKARERRNDLMPDEQAALSVLYMAWERLKDFGWNDPVYCPKDGTEFDVIELGSTGVFSAKYVGEWPDGMWYLMDDRDVYPTARQPSMFRLRKVRVPAYSDPNFKYNAETGSYHHIPAPMGTGSKT
jgi:hypothetical protein